MTISYIVAHQHQASLTLALACLAGCVAWRLSHKQGIHATQLGYLVQSFLAGYAIAKSIFLIYSSFNPNSLQNIPELPIYIAIASCCAIYLAINTLKNAFTDTGKPTHAEPKTPTPTLVPQGTRDREASE